MRAKRQAEGILQRQILNYLHSVGIYAWVNKTQGTYDPRTKCFRRHSTIKGISDILGILEGKLLAIEVKMPGRYATKEQKEFIYQIKSRGGIAFIAYSLDDIITNLQEYLRI